MQALNDPTASIVAPQPDPNVLAAATKCGPGGDCSSFAQSTLGNLGIGGVPRTAIQQFHASTPVTSTPDTSKMNPGDLVFFDNGRRDAYNTAGKAANGGYVNHVGVYLGNDNFVADHGEGDPSTRTPQDLQTYLKQTGYRFMGAGRFGGNPAGGGVPPATPPQDPTASLFAQPGQPEDPTAGLFTQQEPSWWQRIAQAPNAPSEQLSSADLHIQKSEPGWWQQIGQQAKMQQDSQARGEYTPPEPKHVPFNNQAAQIIANAQGTARNRQNAQARGEYLPPDVPKFDPTAAFTASWKDLPGGPSASGDIPGNPQPLFDPLSTQYAKRNPNVGPLGAGTIPPDVYQSQVQRHIAPQLAQVNAGTIPYDQLNDDQQRYVVQGLRLSPQQYEAIRTQGSPKDKLQLTYGAGAFNTAMQNQRDSGINQQLISRQIQPSTGKIDELLQGIPGMGPTPITSMVSGLANTPDSLRRDLDNLTTSDPKTPLLDRLGGAANMGATLFGPAILKGAGKIVGKTAGGLAENLAAKGVAGIPEGEQALNSGLPLNDLANKTLNTNPETGAIYNTSAGAKVRNFLVEGLTNLSKLDPDAAQMARSFGGSMSQANGLIKAAIPYIEQQGGMGSGSFQSVLAPLLQDSRLQGAGQRWTDMAGDVRGMGTPDFQAAYGDQYQGLAKTLGINKPVTDLMAQGTAKATKQAQAMLADAMDNAGIGVTRTMTDDTFNQALQNPGFQKMLAAYKATVEPPLAESHMLNSGVFSQDLGPLNTYYPLTPLDEQGNLMSRMFGRTKPTLGEPGNIHNNFTTGLSAQYDPSVAALGKNLAGAFQTNNRASLIDALRQGGFIEEIGPNDPRASASNQGLYMQGPDGELYDAKRVQLTGPRVVQGQNGIVRVPPKFGMIPSWLTQELGPALEGKGDLDPTGFPGAMAKINAFGMAGPVAAGFHAKNLIGTLIANTPGLTESAGWNAAGVIPGVKQLQTIAKLATVNTWDANAVTDIQRLAKAGALPDKELGYTISKALAEVTGAKKVLPGSPSAILYGPGGLDVRARLIMLRALDATVPNASDQEINQYVNQLGNYNRVGQAGAVAFLKDTGLGPFATASQQMLRNGLNSVNPLATKMAQRGVGSNIANLIMEKVSGGAAGFSATWATGYKMMDPQHRWPWQVSGARYGVLPNGVDLSITNPLATRGMRDAGLSGYYNKAGIPGTPGGQPGGEVGTPGQGADQALRDILNGVISPLSSSPAVKFGTTAAFGVAPHISSLNHGTDVGPSLTQISPKRDGFLEQQGENVKQAVAGVNPLVSFAAHKTGLVEQPAWQTKGDQNPDEDLGRTILAFAGLLARPATSVKSNVKDMRGRQRGALMQNRAP